MSSSLSPLAPLVEEEYASHGVGENDADPYSPSEVHVPVCQSPAPADTREGNTDYYTNESAFGDGLNSGHAHVEQHHDDATERRPKSLAELKERQADEMRRLLSPKYPTPSSVMGTPEGGNKDSGELVINEEEKVQVHEGDKEQSRGGMGGDGDRLVPAEEEKTTKSPRERIADFIHSQPVQIALAVLLVVDVIIVIVELVLQSHTECQLSIEHEHCIPPPPGAFPLITETVVNESGFFAPTGCGVFGETTLSHGIHQAEIVLVWISRIILMIFLAELFVLIACLGRRFFTILYTLDLVIVTASLVLSFIFDNNSKVESETALIIFLRCWRFARVLHGFGVTVHNAEQRHHHHDDDHGNGHDGHHLDSDDEGEKGKNEKTAAMPSPRPHGGHSNTNTNKKKNSAKDHQRTEGSTRCCTCGLRKGARTKEEEERPSGVAAVRCPLVPAASETAMIAVVEAAASTNVDNAEGKHFQPAIMEKATASESSATLLLLRERHQAEVEAYCALLEAELATLRS